MLASSYPTSPAPKKERAFILMAEAQGLSGAEFGKRRLLSLSYQGFYLLIAE